MADQRAKRNPGKLSLLRIRRGLSQGDVGRMLGVSRQAVVLWEMGERTPGLPHAIRLARLLGSTVEELWGWLEGRESA